MATFPLEVLDTESSTALAYSWWWCICRGHIMDSAFNAVMKLLAGRGSAASPAWGKTEAMEQELFRETVFPAPN